jgi:hypothetical protein
MKRTLAIAAGTITTLLAMPVVAAPRDELLAKYAIAAKDTSARFAGFSATRGKTLHTQSFSGSKTDTPSCTTCHGNDPRTPGRGQTGKIIEPVAISVTPLRYANPEKVEKWFKRNCTEVLGRECTPLEKGDWLAYMISQ